jgi:FkbM family methyltransferase
MFIARLNGIGRIPTITEEVKSLFSLINSSANYILFDVGANRGFYSAEARRVYPALKIVAFEPARKTFSILENNTKDLDITCVNLGLGEHLSQLQLHYDFEGSGLASLSKRDLSHFNIDFDLNELVNITTLDIWLSQNKITEKIILKMDVEGHELNVLKGAESALRDQVKLIQFEFGGANISSKVFFEDIWSILEPNFEIYRLTAKGLLPISKYSEDLEFFVNTTYYARVRG